MRMILNLLAVTLIALFLTSCSNVENARTYLKCEGVHHTAQQHYAKSNPITVKLLYGAHRPQCKYETIGNLHVSTHNIVGIKRQEATIHDIMRHLAASIGGNAVIHIQQNKKFAKGDVVRCVD